MTSVFVLLTLQIVLGAVDNFWHHEITERLPSRRAARHETALHAAREFLYGVFFLAIAWATWHGAWAIAVAGLLLIELPITIADFLVEDKTRRLPALERVLHTVLAINVGALLAVFLPVASQWAGTATRIEPVNYGFTSVFLTVAGVSVLAWSFRNAFSALRWLGPTTWQRQPMTIGFAAKPRTVLVTGATGFIGRALCRHLLQRGDRVWILTRDRDKAIDLYGDSVQVVTDLSDIDNHIYLDAVINLAGANVATFPWTQARRRKLLASRLDTTQQIDELLRRLIHTPSVVLSASAVGYYGIHGERRLIEQDRAGSDFPAALCQQWEDAARRFEDTGARVVLLRFGLTLGVSGGVLPRLALPSKFGVSISFGRGDQWVSWIHIDDAIRMMQFAMDNDAITGPLNVTSPQPERHDELIASIARRHHAHWRLRIPAALLRRGLGDMATLLVDGQKVAPLAAAAYGFPFRFEKLSGAIRDLYPRHCAKADIEVLFNGGCPVCSREIQRYIRRTVGSTAEQGILWTDLERTPRALADSRLSPAEARQRLYVRLDSGALISGFDAFIEVWRRVPGMGWLARIGALPPCRAVGRLSYDYVAAPALAFINRHRDTSRNPNLAESQ